MRITNSMLVSNFLSDLNVNMNSMSRFQTQLASGRRLNRLSDDPVGLLSVLNARSKLSNVETNTAAIDDAKAWLTQTETSLTEINEVINTAYENAVRAANGTMEQTDREAVATLVSQMKQHAVQLGNATYGNRYIFGGYNTTQPPFSYDAGGALLYNGVDLTSANPAIPALAAQSMQYATGEGVLTKVSFNGVDLMGTGADNLYKILDDLETMLKNPAVTSTDLLQSAELLKGAQQNTLSMIAEVGGKHNRLNVMQTSIDSNELNYTELLSKNQDIDQAEVTMQFKMAEAIYRAALQVGAQVIQPTLVDFMR